MPGDDQEADVMDGLAYLGGDGAARRAIAVMEGSHVDHRDVEQHGELLKIELRGEVGEEETGQPRVEPSGRAKQGPHRH